MAAIKIKTSKLLPLNTTENDNKIEQLFWGKVKIEQAFAVFDFVKQYVTSNDHGDYICKGCGETWRELRR